MWNAGHHVDWTGRSSNTTPQTQVGSMAHQEADPPTEQRRGFSPSCL